jgi:UDP-GlcNAc3NAcA epimerase
MRIVSIVGARPQFVKLAVICRALQRHASADHSIIHTGQHYDDAMSGAFFRDLSIPEPAVNLEVGSGSHGEQTGEIMRRLEPVLASARPDWVLLYGDTNSTAAAALTAAKMHFPIAHVEAGLRSFNRRMPEEINRIVTDHVSDLLLCPTAASMQNLCREGLKDRAVITGDVMFDAVLATVSMAESRADAPAYAYPPQSYALATVHRAENTDDAARLSAILCALERVARDICPVLLVVHPRTAKVVAANGWEPQHVTIMPAVAYPDMLLLEKRARMIITDSGGVQKEAYFLRIPCITVRDETEWVETLENSCNVVAGASDPERIYVAARESQSAGPWHQPYGSGSAGLVIADCLLGQQLTGCATGAAQ